MKDLDVIVDASTSDYYFVTAAVGTAGIKNCEKWKAN